MKLCIPIKDNKGLESSVYSHFGSAPAFLLFETENEHLEVINNADKQHTHGKCEPMDSIKGKDVDIVIVGGIGRRAINKLHSLEIEVFKSETGTAMYNVDLFRKSLLKEFTPDDGCAHHEGKHRHA